MSSRLLAWLRHAVTAEWHGPADLPASLTMEWRLVAIRWVGLLALGPVLPLMHLPEHRLFPASMLLLAGMVYNVTVRWHIQRRPGLFANGYLTTVCDSLLTIAMILIGGGFDGPLSYLAFTVTISVCMRYGYGPGLAVTAIYALADALEQLLFGNSPDAAFAFRSGFLVITALLASYLFTQATRAKEALHDRLVELQRLYADLALAHQELLSLDEAKTNFLANVSHELRTPLTSIRAFSEILQNYRSDEDTEQEFLQIITDETERLTRLVNDVLDVTKIESGEMYWRDEKINPTKLLEQCARTVAPLFEDAALQFRQEIPGDLPPIRGDHDRLQQVVQNLLNNAMKFTSQGAITLRAAAVGGELRIEVADTGVGIAPCDQQRVFEKFQQVGDTLTGKPKGTGLGLTICRDIVVHHGGRLTVDSELGRGSTFTIVLPIAGSPELAAAA